MIQVRQVSKRYGSLLAVDNVTVDIKKNRITSLIGPNGAGKSTLLSVISRLVPMDAGDVLIEGRSVRRWNSTELARTVAILKQSNHLNLRLTVRELVSFGRFPYSQGRLTKADLEHVDRAIEYLNLGDLQHKFLDELSGGERQRAFIAMVVAQDTDYILLDEPLNNLDMKHAVHIMQVLRQLVDDMGKTVVLVLHDINFASSFSDDIVAMKNGRLVACGSVDEIIRGDVLHRVYEMQFDIHEFDRCKVCLYFLPQLTNGRTRAPADGTIDTAMPVSRH
ncbi:MAG: ATP-binding cassette domain-containing protein [Limnochordales bacterium]|jgi:ABC-type enterochelin transport system, ATPase component|nr:iron ABC transporter ATP-binding protein [Bacillota bacterium]